MTHVAWGVILACGKNEQMTSGVETAFLNLGSKPVIAYSLQAYEQCPDIAGVVLVVSKERVESVTGMVQMFGFSKVQKIVAGSSARLSCVLSALKNLDEEVTIVSVHEASRPCITPEFISETVRVAKRYGSAVVGTEIFDPVKEVEKGLSVKKSLNGHALWITQSPQTYLRDVLQKSCDSASKKHIDVDDEATAVDYAGKEVRMMASSINNLKIRTPEEFNLAMFLLKL